MDQNFPAHVFSHRTSCNAEGELVIDGIKVSELAAQFGTPVFVLDEADFRTRALAWKRALESSFQEHSGKVFYAAKAFLCVEVARWLSDLGIGLDVCSGGELAVAQAAKFPAAHMEFHGNNKSEAEINQALDYGVAIIVIDSEYEIERVNRLAGAKGIIQKVYVRITPGVEAHTHDFISTAHEDVKFGFSIASGAAERAIDLVMDAQNLELVGLHSHIGSQIFESDGFTLAAARVIGLMAQVREKHGKNLASLNIGGGYGIAYLPDEQSVDPQEILGQLAEVIRQQISVTGLSMPSISIEPGRAIVGPSMTTIYQVGTTKEVSLADGSLRRYISIDGGMSDNIRPALYSAQYFAILANRHSSAELVDSRIVGKHCESGDIVIRSIELPSDIRPGDLIAIPATGAYGRSMASNYNHIPRPPVIAISESRARIIVRREKHQDLLALDVTE